MGMQTEKLNYIQYVQEGQAKMFPLGVGEMAQWFESFTTASNYSSRGSDALFGPL